MGTVPKGQSPVFVVARGGAVREANHDARSAPRRGENRPEPIRVNGTLASPARTACVCRRCAPRLNHRHADFQSRVGSPEALYFKELPGRPLLDLHHCALRCTAHSRKTHAHHISAAAEKSAIWRDWNPHVPDKVLTMCPEYT